MLAGSSAFFLVAGLIQAGMGIWQMAQGESQRNDMLDTARENSKAIKTERDKQERIQNNDRKIKRTIDEATFKQQKNEVASQANTKNLFAGYLEDKAQYLKMQVAQNDANSNSLKLDEYFSGNALYSY